MTVQRINLAFILSSGKAFRLIPGLTQKYGVISKPQFCHKSALFPFLSFLLCFLFLTGCASLPRSSDILVLVDGEPITAGDYIYSLEIAHRREDMSSAHSLDLQDYLQKLINDKLVVQEARRMNMENHPEVKQKAEAYILRESVTRLYDEEVLKKVSVTEEDITRHYRENYERFTLSVIEAGTREEAEKLFQQLKGGSSFGDLAQEHAPHTLKDHSEVVMTRKSLGSRFGDSVDALQEGEFSDIIESGGRYYILKLINRQDASEDDMEGIKGKIAREVEQAMIKERSAEYLRHLRESIDPKVHEDVLAAIVFDGKDDARQKWLKDERPLAEVNGSVLTAGAFTSMLSDTSANKEAVLARWLERKLIDTEALRRAYDRTSDLGEMARRYEEQILKNTFITTVLIPQISISDQELEEYYADHKDQFLKPGSYRVQQITVKSREDAQDIENSLKSGASFSWLAKTRSADSHAQTGGDAGWVMKSGLPRPLQDVIDSMEPGDLSPVIEVGEYYRIYMLQEKTKKEHEDFITVRSSIQSKVFREKLDELIGDYTERLRKDSDVVIYPEAVDSFEKGIKNAKN